MFDGRYEFGLKQAIVVAVLATAIAVAVAIAVS